MNDKQTRLLEALRPIVTGAVTEENLLNLLIVGHRVMQQGSGLMYSDAQQLIQQAFHEASPNRTIQLRRRRDLPPLAMEKSSLIYRQLLLLKEHLETGCDIRFIKRHSEFHRAPLNLFTSDLFRRAEWLYKQFDKPLLAKRFTDLPVVARETVDLIKAAFQGASEGDAKLLEVALRMNFTNRAIAVAMEMTTGTVTTALAAMMIRLKLRFPTLSDIPYPEPDNRMAVLRLYKERLHTILEELHDRERNQDQATPEAQ